MFAHGHNYYLKSVNQSGPRSEVAKRVFEKVCKLNSAPGNEIQHFYIHEYITHRAVLAVPEGTTAFVRPHGSMTGAALKWAKNSPSTEEAARRAGHELTNIVAEVEAQVSGGKDNMGYANFCQFHFQPSFYRVHM